MRLQKSLLLHKQGSFHDSNPMLRYIEPLKALIIPTAESGLKIYAIVDAGIGGKVLLNAVDVQFQALSLPLFPGKETYSLRSVSPLLVDLQNKPELVNWLLEHS